MNTDCFCLISKRAINLIALVLLSLLLMPRPSTLANNQPDEIDFYLPILGNNKQTLIVDLQSLLKQHKLGNINLRSIDHWHDYQHGLRAGRPGIYLAPPHFAAWSIHQHRFIPLLRIGTPLSYVVAARRNDVDVFEMNDLAGHTVCVSKPLNLDYLTIINAFDDTLLSAKIRIVPDVYQELHQNNNDCRGFALNNAAYERIEKEFPDRFIRLHQSSRFMNLVYVAHPEIPSTIIADLMQLLTQPAARNLLTTVYLDYSSGSSLLRARKADYPQHYYFQLLKFWDENQR